MKPSADRRVFEIVRAKRASQEPPLPCEAALEQEIGSKGWHTRGYLPHFDKPGLLQMVTFRLADAMPASRRREWEALLSLEDEQDKHDKLEDYLDRGHGECLLNDPRVARLVEEVLLFHDGERYRLVAWVVMPNHVHVLFEQWLVPIHQQMKAWKGVSSRAINRVIGRKGARWQSDYWDRYIRDEEHFRQVQHYVEWNPVKAFLVQDPANWGFSSIHPQWRWSGPDRYTGVHLMNKPTVWTVESVLAGKGTRAAVEEGETSP